MPKALISDRGTHFCNKIMERPMKRYGVNHRFSTPYHPHTSGQVENTNIALKRILEKNVKDNPTIWSRKLDDALWAFRIAYKTPTVALHAKNSIFDANHDMCVVNYLSDVNARARARTVKSIKKKEWKPTGKMFKNVGYKWVPTGRNFTIVGNRCPLTRFTPTKYFNPPPPAISSDLVVVAAPRAVDPSNSHLSSTIDQDAPYAGTLPTNQKIQSQVIHQGVEEQIHGNQNA
ncbi:reverse transcriptase domain-containing protein [Tanacetum coccineum]